MFLIINGLTLAKGNKVLSIGNYKINDQKFYKFQSISSSEDDMYLALTTLSYKSVEVRNTAEGENEPPKEQTYDLDLFIFNKAVVDAVKSSHKDPFEPIFEKGSHHGSILNLEVCPSKILIASLDNQKTIKFWEFGLENKELLSYTFHDNAQCMAFHPLSFQLAVGFKEG